MVCLVVMIVLKDVFVIENVWNSWIVRIEGCKNWLLFLFKFNVIIVLDLSYKNNFIVRLGIVRFRRYLLKDVGIDGKYNMVLIVRIF